MAMTLRRKAILALAVVAVCVMIKLYSLNPHRVETGYSSQFFPFFASLLRATLGKLPVSVGDLLYAILVFLLVLGCVRLTRKAATGVKLLSGAIIKNKILSLLIFFGSIYIVFNLFWGINYNRKGIAWQLGLPTLEYTQTELVEMNCMLLAKVNQSKFSLQSRDLNYPTTSQLFNGIHDAYKILGEKYPFLKYENASLKKSMWGWLGNYAGFTGYYNPFTGEAQVNTSVPRFLQPFTSCHEVAHQLGYAKEMEANFVGYLAASTSKDPLFNYSVYLDLFTYANRNLFATDSIAAKSIRNDLSTAVKDDLKEWMLFNKKHRSFLEPLVRWGYGIFLRNNEQPQGILSYDEVTGFIIAYYKKNGRI